MAAVGGGEGGAGPIQGDEMASQKGRGRGVAAMALHVADRGGLQVGEVALDSGDGGVHAPRGQAGL